MDDAVPWTDPTLITGETEESYLSMSIHLLPQLQGTPVAIIPHHYRLYHVNQEPEQTPFLYVVPCQVFVTSVKKVN